MSCTVRHIAPGLLAAVLVSPLSAEPTPAPPAWQDGASIYLEMSQKAPLPVGPTKLEPRSAEAKLQSTAVPTAPRIIDAAVTPAVHSEKITPDSQPAAKTDSRHLAPPSAKRAQGHSGPIASDQNNPPRSGSRRLADFGLPLDSMYTILTALAVVIGAFLVFAWALRRGGRGLSGRRGSLPADVVSVLGRVPLAARQFAELLRVGNKLVLVSLTPTGAETLTEVTDPAEVDRLVGLCQQHDPHSTSKAFEQVFRQLSDEAAPGGFLGHESHPSSHASPAAAYRAHRGATRG